jgi:prepilin signal peptidase PulO-like enzyme (type II secretory pathway)
MQGAFIVFAGILGAVTGSFLSVLVERLPKGEDIVWRRSACPHCKKTLGPHELIPIVSFVIQRGLCRGCGTSIGWRYIFLEIAAGSLFSYTVWQCPGLGACFFDLPVIFWWFFFDALLLIAVVDGIHFAIPASVLSATMLIAVLTRAAAAPHTFTAAALGAIIGGGLFWLLVTVSQERWMGMGDAELGALAGWVVGFPAVLFLLTVAAMAGGLWGMTLLALGKKRFGEALPFAPFLVFGLAATVVMRPLVGFIYAAL